MSSVPPDIVGSSAQAGYQQADVAKIRDGERAAQANATARQAKAVDEAGSSITANDGDVEVYADAEGGGGQGRANEEEENTQDETNETQDGVRQDDDGEIHLDLQA
jgi:hypothetical protein